MIHLETEKSAEPKGKTEISRDFFVPHLSISRFAVAESPASSLFARAESIIYTSERQFETSVSGSDGEAFSFSSWIRRDEQQVPQHSVHCPMYLSLQSGTPSWEGVLKILHNSTVRFTAPL